MNQVDVNVIKNTVTIVEDVTQVSVVEQVTEVIEITSDLLPPTRILSGTSAPTSSVGRTGDFYINTTTSEMYGPKDSTTVWGSPFAFMGSSELPMSIPGTLAVGIGVQPFLTTRSLKIVRCRAACATAPTGQDIIFDINRNGSTIFTNQAYRPRIVAGSTLGAVTVPDIVAIEPGDIITVDVDQVGSAIIGANATLVLELI